MVATSVVGISKRFGKTSVLENINFEVAEGEALVLLGASGSGKTTILRIIAGLEQPYTGKVMLHGKDVTELPARERGVGVIFQSYALFPKMTVEKNIGYGLTNQASQAERDPRDCERAPFARATRRTSQEISFSTFRWSAATRGDCAHARLQP